MSHVLDTLADLTALRDRDVLDVSLAGALKDLLQPLAVTIYRRVGEPDNERWLLRARLGGSDLAARSDPAWVELDALPRLAEQPLHERALNRRDLVLQDADADGRVPAAAGRGALAVFPLSGDAGSLGVVEVETESPLDAAAQALVASVLRLHRNFQSLLDDSERDTLTGLRNRKTFDREFLKLTTEPMAMAAGRRPGNADAAIGCCWLGVIDIDHFKRVNDVHGHLIGDEVLLMLSRLMTRSFRLNDHLFRFGGEEFVVLMRCADEPQALAGLERLRGLVQAFAFPRVGQVTISIGSSAVRPGEPPSAAFQRADQAVYWAKAHGRNQVASFADLAARGELHDDTRSGDVELF